MHIALLALAAILIPIKSPPSDSTRVIDLTQTLSPTSPIYPGGHPLHITPLANLDSDGYYMNAITLGEHTGTHMDAPLHFIKGGLSIDQVPPEHLVGPGIVIDIRAKCEANPDYQLTYLDVKQWESQHGRIPIGAILIVHTGWSDKWTTPKQYLNLDGEGVLHFPGLSVEVAEYLITYRDVSGVGIDTLSIDYGPSQDFEAHRILHGDGIFHIENVAIPPDLPPTGSTIIVAPLKIQDGSGAPCRVLALVNEEPSPLPAIEGEKFLIEFGWDIPDERTLAKAATAGTPFDGAVFEPHIRNPDGSSRPFTWMIFGRESIANDQTLRIIDDLKKAPMKFRQHSFLRVNVTPGDVDWFDDWAAILVNARAAASIVRMAECGGILFDVEQYEGKLFDYRTRPPGRSFAEFEAQARRRGREFAQELNNTHPDIAIMLTYGHCLSDRTKARATYGLLPAFLDGMLDTGMTPNRLIDGYEYSYPFKSRRAFERGRDEVRRESNGKLSVGFGIWVDWNSGTYPWRTDDVSENWFSPAEFGAAVGHALQLADKYVWIYSERLNWWTREHMPDAYVEALQKAKSDETH